jgi:fatty-acyl-CoA synthase
MLTPMTASTRSPASGKAERAGRGAALGAWIRALDASKSLHDAPFLTLPAMLPQLADTHQERPALLGTGVALSYRALAAWANQYARWAIANGLGRGDVVGLLMLNCPAYVATWLGLTRAGCAVALINTNLATDALLHSIEVAAARHLIVSASLLPPVIALADRLPPGLQVRVHGEGDAGRWLRIEQETNQLGTAPLDPGRHPLPAQRDRALLIYTSGTTGLPKAANVSHGRIAEWSLWFAGLMDVQPDDRLYDCLPMYHSVGGIVGVGSMLVRGGSLVIRERFSASRFWDDVADNGCTIFQYIGELCRYLSLSSPHPKERLHRLRLACGNGLAGDVWEKFQQRFGIPQILEFYAATEGIVSLYNTEGRPGAIGRIPSFLAHRFPVALIRCDPETGEPWRDESGLCIACPPDEAGEAIGQLPDGDAPAARHFDGYTDAAASGRKILRDVFSKGDRWFRTGDLLRKDAAGYFYFVDRIGETFRWRGENVSTTEVAGVLRACPGITDAVVFGVPVPGNDGRAGMAAVTTAAGFDLAVLKAHLDAYLPHYAQPLFIRCCETLDFTGTFKLTKGRLIQEGYSESTEPVWFNDRGGERFVACDRALIQSIEGGSRRL